MEIKKWLEQFPSSEELANLYQSWREKYPPLKSFSLPKQLIEFLHSREPANFKAQDEILCSLISECQLSKEPSILVMYLFILLYPFFEIPFYYWKKQVWKYQIPDEEIWNEIWIAFYEILNEIDLEKRKEKIGLFFQSKVGNHLKRIYRNVVREAESTIIYQDELKPFEIYLPQKKKKEEFSKEEILEMELILDQLVSKRIIDSIDKYIIAATKLWRMPLKEVARKLNLSYDAAQRKGVRAKIKIAKALRKK
ncbi:MAG: hypothetical protein AB1349_07545 [Elusimicrobiota bacterium]